VIKSIIFDFDGVLVESAEIKTEAFRKLFSTWPDNVDEIVAYHLKNAGLSRYVKFRYIFEKILQKDYSEELIHGLGETFSQLVLEAVKKAPFVPGAVDFLVTNTNRYLLFIASGTPQRELSEIVSVRGIARYFKGIFGTPSSKSEIIRTVINEYKLQKDDILFIGDGDSDRMAAAEMGIHFILRRTRENGELVSLVSHPIDDLTQLERMIEDI
jgi:phosphoglycolate phosphatase-like HAD superfamily hydrolase